jgi:hypothetical protein
MTNPEVRSDDFAFVYLDVDYPPVAWLAYRGVLNSCDIGTANPGNLSLFLMDAVQRGLNSTLRREGVLEGFRLKEYPSFISRLKCVYAWPTLDMATRGSQGRGKFQEKNLVAIAPRNNNYRRQEHDSNWITDFDSLPIDTGRKYWVGATTKAPLMECLLSGSFHILGTSVRERAYATIKRTNPNSLAMLELSRLAAVFESDLGSSSPWIKREGERLIATFIIKYTEIEGLQIFTKALLEKQNNPAFQLNIVDLEPLTKTEAGAELDAKFAVPDMRVYEKSFRIEKLSELNRFARLIIDGKFD